MAYGVIVAVIFVILVAIYASKKKRTKIKKKNCEKQETTSWRLPYH